MLNRDTVLLARLDSGEHVQVGRACHWDDAYVHFEYLDSQISGFHRVNGRLRFTPPTRQHFLGGEKVSFYRLRGINHEFGNVRQFPLSAIRYTSGRKAKENTSMTTKTASGIARPRTGGFAKWDYARQVAKRANASGVGRGHRAIKAQDGNYTVVFRPAVVNNKQRKVRAI